MKLNIEAIRQKTTVKKSVAVEQRSDIIEIKLPDEKKDLKTTKLDLTDDLSAKLAKVKKERAILSTSTHALIKNLAAELAKESPAKAALLLEGRIAHPLIAEQYKKILSCSNQWAELYDKIRTVQEHGALPEEKVQLLDEQSEEIKMLNNDIRRLDDLIFKTNQKLQSAKPKNPSRISEWKEKLALAIATRDDLKIKRKQLQHGKRAQRTG
ncbi:MAG: hypothetical protein O9340_04500 [Cyclobacteriaceae bacterium]|nr:hypothetical protein [Cyclobacteriaceae bacterium]